MCSPQKMHEQDHADSCPPDMSGFFDVATLETLGVGALDIGPTSPRSSSSAETPTLNGPSAEPTAPDRDKDVNSALPTAPSYDILARLRGWSSGSDRAQGAAATPDESEAAVHDVGPLCDLSADKLLQPVKQTSPISAVAFGGPTADASSTTLRKTDDCCEKQATGFSRPWSETLGHAPGPLGDTAKAEATTVGHESGSAALLAGLWTQPVADNQRDRLHWRAVAEAGWEASTMAAIDPHIQRAIKSKPWPRIVIFGQGSGGSALASTQRFGADALVWVVSSDRGARSLERHGCLVVRWPSRASLSPETSSLSDLVRALPWETIDVVIDVGTVRSRSLRERTLAVLLPHLSAGAVYACAADCRLPLPAAGINRIVVHQHSRAVVVEVGV